ncbi:MAG: M23 family metallopeptidase [Bdellovibrionales bacterium]|nr:M23 family metallopeptidase [Bdellovibrionales bacterium]
MKILSVTSLLSLAACAPLNYNVRNYDGQSELQIPSYSTQQLKGESEYQPQSDFYLQWPVGKVNLSQAFRPRKNRHHEGIDLTHYFNAPIYSAHEGYVVYVGQAYRGYGKMIILQYSHRWATLYAHLNKIEVREGQVIERGQIIGRMGRTGKVTGTHLHFELLKNKIPIDPLEFLPFNRSIAGQR